MAVEIRRSRAPGVSQGLDIACEGLGAVQRFAACPGKEGIPLRHGAQAVGLVALMRRLRQG